MLGGDRLGERAVERGDVGDLDLVADAALGEVPVGQEAELERRDRALDRHVDHVDDEPATVERRQRGAERGRPFGRVEGEDVLHPSRTGETLGLLGHQPGAGGDDKHVVAERAAVGEVHLVGSDVDPVDGGLDEADAIAQLPFSRPHDVLAVGQPERHEQQPRLVDVAVVLVDHGDLGLVHPIPTPQPVRDQRAARPTAEHDNARFHTPNLRPRPLRQIEAKVTRRLGDDVTTSCRTLAKRTHRTIDRRKHFEHPHRREHVGSL